MWHNFALYYWKLVHGLDSLNKQQLFNVNLYSYYSCRHCYTCYTIIALYLHFILYFCINDHFCPSLYHILLILSAVNHTTGQLLNVSLRREYNISTVFSCQQYDVAWSLSILTYVRNNLRNNSKVWRTTHLGSFFGLTTFVFLSLDL